MCRIILFTAACLALMPPCAHCQPARGEKYAFLVVCSKYNNTQLRDLPYTIEEMEDFRKALLKTGFDADHIVMLHDKAERERVPLKQSIEKQFRLLLNGLQAKDTVIVAINGHGVHFKGDKVGYYCPLGADLKDKKSLVSMEFFYDLLKKSKAKQKLMIVQACQNDPFVSNDFAAERLEFTEKSDEVPEGIAAIFSCMEGQKSYYDPDRKRGLFFDHVIRSWNGEYLRGSETKLDLESFFQQVRVKTKADALKFRGGVEQVPEVRREYKGEWVLASTIPVRPNPLDREKKSTTIRIGIIGLDSSHAPAFTALFNDSNNEGDLAGFKVVAAFPGGSSDIDVSRLRVESFTKMVKEKHGVEIVNSIDALLQKVDAVMILSVDGRPHLTQATPVFKARKPVFIDKPLGGSLADVLYIFDLAKQHQTPVFSSSALRFTDAVGTVKRELKVGKILRCVSTSPCPTEENHPDLFWYGIHGVESLFTIMGLGCESVSRSRNDEIDTVKGVWQGDRQGIYRGIRSGQSATFGVEAFGEKEEIKHSDIQPTYKPLVTEIAKFFRTGQAPVSPEETIEIYAFMEAADESRRLEGRPVSLISVLETARNRNRDRKRP